MPKTIDLSPKWMLQSSPEKDPGDPLLAATGSRPRRQYAAQGSQQTVEYVHFEEPEPDCFLDQPVLKSHQDRLSWDHHAWKRFTGPMEDRVIRNLLLLKPSSHMTGSGGLERILWKITGFVNTQIAHPIHVPKSIHACDISKASFTFVK